VTLYSAGDIATVRMQVVLFTPDDPPNRSGATEALNTIADAGRVRQKLYLAQLSDQGSGRGG